ncbi:hypothetical protein BCR34DRAFT_563278 [Clohesyomyces aquaticus]|uniref:Uncharacterized protein n=1 Tax=Clohesyomyces aquaticus TaxID=1231657 RepID=A0A1Y1ZR35_9PLEO|nr:hypothetical protein BCR34DRAFT_563278 [Clohesyomyces aquaticus]
MSDFDETLPATEAEAPEAPEVLGAQTDLCWEEAERMAQAMTCTDALKAADRPTTDEINRWMRLFKYDPIQAIDAISEQRQDLARDRISDDHWELVKDEKEAMGYDRETYEHSLRLGDILKSQSMTIPNEDGADVFIFQLGGLLDSALQVQQVAGLEELPKVVRGIGSEGRGVRFCSVTKDAQKKIEAYLAQRQIIGVDNEAQRKRFQETKELRLA